MRDHRSGAPNVISVLVKETPFYFQAFANHACDSIRHDSAFGKFSRSARSFSRPLASLLILKSRKLITLTGKSSSVVSTLSG